MFRMEVHDSANTPSVPSAFSSTFQRCSRCVNHMVKRLVCVHCCLKMFNRFRGSTKFVKAETSRVQPFGELSGLSDVHFHCQVTHRRPVTATSTNLPLGPPQFALLTVPVTVCSDQSPRCRQTCILEIQQQDAPLCGATAVSSRPRRCASGVSCICIECQEMSLEANR